MPISHPPPLTAEDYDRLAREYQATLPLEHYMESTFQATQREITSASLAVVRAHHPVVKYFNELLVQYRVEGEVRRVVPDQMIVLGANDKPRKSYAIELEPHDPFMMIEWVSDSSEGKDYGESYDKYEQDLATPYCLMYHPEKRELNVYHHQDGQYVRMEPNASGRYEIPELEMEIGLLDGWVRYWFRGELIDLPAELDRQRRELGKKLAEQQKQLELASQQLETKSKKIESQSKTIAEQAEQLKAREQSAGELEARYEATVTLLRRTVELLARAAERQDILDQLPQADNVERLEAWIEELQ